MRNTFKILYLVQSHKTDQTGNAPLYVDKELSEKPADIVIIDAFGDVVKGDLNNMTVVRSALADYKTLVDKHGCAFMFLHHVSKASRGKASKHQLNGSQGIEGKMRTVVMLNKNEGDSRSISIVKGNYTKDRLKNIEYPLLFDDNMVFHRVDQSELLATPKSKFTREYLEGTFYVMNKVQGHSHETIAAIFTTKRGHTIGSTAVGNYIREYEAKYK